jgi:hypothetical protein
VLKSSVSGQDGVVWLNNRGRDLRSWVHAELQLALLAVVNRKTLHEKSTESGTSSTTERVEDEETLKTGAVVCNTADLVKDGVNQLLANSVVTTSVIVGRILLSGDHVLWVEKVAVLSGADLVDHVGLKIGVDGTWNVLALT